MSDQYADVLDVEPSVEMAAHFGSLAHHQKAAQAQAQAQQTQAQAQRVQAARPAAAAAAAAANPDAPQPMPLHALQREYSINRGPRVVRMQAVVPQSGYGDAQTEYAFMPDASANAASAVQQVQQMHAAAAAAAAAAAGARDYAQYGAYGRGSSFQNDGMDDDDDDDDVDDGVYDDDDDDVPVVAPVQSGDGSSQQHYIHPGTESMLKTFAKVLASQNGRDIQTFYETTYRQHIERYYANHPQPHPDSVAALVTRDPNFLMLYRQMYYRHAWTSLTPNVHTRIESWENYLQLFQRILEAPGDLGLELPDVWIWDVVSEFVYQFQVFALWRFKAKGKSADDFAVLRESPHVWNAAAVIDILQRVIVKTNIEPFLSKAETAEPDDEFDFAQVLFFRKLGYFSILALSRVHLLLGDYTSALQVLRPIDLKQRIDFSRVPSCHVNLFYNVAFCCLMSRRYVDCSRLLCNALLVFKRTERVWSRGPQAQQISKRCEQMYAMLAIALSLCPQRVDETIHYVVRENYGDKTQRMQKGEEDVFVELFKFAAPKFVTPCVPDYDAEGYSERANETANVQQLMFMREVREQAVLGTLRSYLRLYTSIGLDKLGAFTSMDAAQLRASLLCFKHKTSNPLWMGGPPAAGNRVSSGDVAFAVEDDMITIHDSKPQRRFLEHFCTQILELERERNRR